MNRRWISTLALLALALTGLAATAQQLVEISQRNRAFAPRAVTIARGDTLVFVNDDGELLHHVHSSDPAFAFDTGEQPAGTRSPVRFTTRGAFDIRCAIHPRMLLRVTVQ